MDRFYAFLGEEKTTREIRLAVMDMWKPFRKSTQAHAPQAAILFDKFHVIRHLGEALDKVRKYARLAGANGGTSRDRNTRCCRARRISPSRAKSTEDIVGGQQAAEHGLSSQGEPWPAVELRTRGLGAAVLRELAGESQVAAAQALREIRRDDRSSLGRIAAYCRPENKVSLGFVEGLNNKIR